MVYRPGTAATAVAAGAGAADPEPDGPVSTCPRLAEIDGERHAIDKQVIVLGRSQDCDIQLADPNVSRRHAEVRQEESSYWIVDLGSTNGMEVNGRRLRAGEARGRRRITLGSTELVFEREAPMTLGSVAVAEVLLLLKIGFLVLLYLFIWRVVRTASRDLRGARRRASILAPAAGAGSAAQQRGRRESRRASSSSSRSPSLRAETSVTIDSAAALRRPRRRERRAARPATSSRPAATPASSLGATASGSRTSARRTAPTSTASRLTAPRKLVAGRRDPHRRDRPALRAMTLARSPQSADTGRRRRRNEDCVRLRPAAVRDRRRDGRRAGRRDRVAPRGRSLQRREPPRPVDGEERVDAADPGREPARLRAGADGRVDLRHGHDDDGRARRRRHRPRSATSATRAPTSSATTRSSS